MIILISFTGAVCIFALINLLLTSFFKKQTERKRFGKYLGAVKMEDIPDQVFKERWKRNRGTKGNIKFVSKEFATLVASSGIKLTPSEFLYVWIAVAFIPMLLFAFISGNIISITGAGIVGLVVPPILLNVAIKKRQDLFSKQLGEALMIIGNNLKGGFSFQQALDGVAKEMEPPLSSEFEKVMREIRFGLPMEEALKHMADRVNNKDLDLFVSAVLVSIQVGSNMTEILDTIADTIRDRIRIKQEVKVMTATGRISGMIIGLMPVFIIVMLMMLNPTYFYGFFDTTMGKALFALAGVLEVTGFLVIRKISDIKY